MKNRAAKKNKKCVHEIANPSILYFIIDVRNKREEISRRAQMTARSFSWVQPRSMDEYEIFSAVQGTVGEAGELCSVDYCENYNKIYL